MNVGNEYGEAAGGRKYFSCAALAKKIVPPEVLDQCIREALAQALQRLRWELLCE